MSVLHIPQKDKTLGLRDSAPPSDVTVYSSNGTRIEPPTFWCDIFNNNAIKRPATRKGKLNDNRQITQD